MSELLTPKQIRQITSENPDWDNGMLPYLQAQHIKSTKTERERIGNWGNEPCKDTSHASGGFFFATHGYYSHKKGCFECWQALKNQAIIEARDKLSETTPKPTPEATKSTRKAVKGESNTTDRVK